MKKFAAFTLVSLLAGAACGADLWFIPGGHVFHRPDPVVLDGLAIFTPSDATIAAAGIVKAEYPDGMSPADLVIDDGAKTVRPMTEQELAAREETAVLAAAQAEAARQLAKPLSLKRAENNFFLMCAALFQGDLSKRGFAELGAAVEAYAAADPQAGVVLAVKLLTVDAEAKREGGLQWWDDARFHPEIVE